jgi:hypothetical protein
MYNINIKKNKNLSKNKLFLFQLKLARFYSGIRPHQRFGPDVEFVIRLRNRDRFLSILSISKISFTNGLELKVYKWKTSSPLVIKAFTLNGPSGPHNKRT